MSISIYNCFSWIGYHYVHYFLEEGIEVNGIDKIDSEKKKISICSSVGIVRFA